MYKEIVVSQLSVEQKMKQTYGDTHKPLKQDL